MCIATKLVVVRFIITQRSPKVGNYFQLTVSIDSWVWPKPKLWMKTPLLICERSELCLSNTRIHIQSARKNPPLHPAKLCGIERWTWWRLSCVFAEAPNDRKAFTLIGWKFAFATSPKNTERISTDRMRIQTLLMFWTKWFGFLVEKNI